MDKLSKKHLRRLRIRRGLNSQRHDVLFEEGEPVFIKDKKSVFIGNNKTYGGVLATTINHIIYDNKVPQTGNAFDIVINGNPQGGGYLIDENNNLKTIFQSNTEIQSITNQINELSNLLDRLSVECCNPDFRLITDSGIDILTDNNDWISIRPNSMCNNTPVSKPTGK